MQSFRPEHRLVYLLETMNPLHHLLQPQMLEGLAKLEAASQPSEVARIHSEKEKYLQASNLLFQMYYGKRDAQAEGRPAPEAKTDTGFPRAEQVLVQLIQHWGCQQLLREFQQELDGALKSGSAVKMELASGKLDMLQQMISAQKQLMMQYSRAFQPVVQGLDSYKGSFFETDDKLGVFLVHLPADHWPQPVLQAEGEYSGMTLPMSMDANGTYRLPLSQRPSDTSNGLDEVQRLDREIYSMCMELKLVQDGVGIASHETAVRLGKEIEMASRRRETIRMKRSA